MSYVLKAPLTFVQKLFLHDLKEEAMSSGTTKVDKAIEKGSSSIDDIYLWHVRASPRPQVSLKHVNLSRIGVSFKKLCLYIRAKKQNFAIIKSCHFSIRQHLGCKIVRVISKNTLTLEYNAPPLGSKLARVFYFPHKSILRITSIFCDVDAEETQDRWQCCLVLFFSARKIVLKHISYVIKRNCMHFHIRSVQSCWDNKCSLQVLFSGSMVTYFDFRWLRF